MGKSSITDEQKKWLESHIPAFTEVQKKSTVARFHPHIAEGWFEKYPERNALFPTAAGELSAVLTHHRRIRLAGRFLLDVLVHFQKLEGQYINTTTTLGQRAMVVETSMKLTQDLKKEFLCVCLTQNCFSTRSLSGKSFQLHRSGT
ncbi:uncharacterized protein LACBIDRAFT_298913 [Laccaria bicolor S238N-H82]|uniref:Predicted protein n=1 Tax=Laccaria bicolor (strain S238N-H82 / ATCC MYA-4686) TaxID=486041 RepID=B0DDK8_LACBS|nr:uncharacterized protein LACBIDRAFT_298913 [Laccaria bicolor S238N-H82]EDR07105.1 predicted protein [Laccaria bicolor S238N-H82]|eukprot:XP_001882036.1 predicted protein [Laccaria bicolor S238N-H82]